MMAYFSINRIVKLKYRYEKFICKHNNLVLTFDNCPVFILSRRNHKSHLNIQNIIYNAFIIPLIFFN